MDRAQELLATGSDRSSGTYTVLSLNVWCVNVCTLGCSCPHCCECRRVNCGSSSERHFAAGEGSVMDGRQSDGPYKQHFNKHKYNYEITLRSLTASRRPQTQLPFSTMDTRDNSDCSSISRCTMVLPEHSHRFSRQSLLVLLAEHLQGSMPHRRRTSRLYPSVAPTTR